MVQPRRSAASAAVAGEFSERHLHYLTPWDPQEICRLWLPPGPAPCGSRSLCHEASEKVLDRGALGLAPATEAATGVYLLRRPRGSGDGTVVLQESAVTYAFIEVALRCLKKKGSTLGYTM